MVAAKATWVTESSGFINCHFHCSSGTPLGCKLLVPWGNGTCGKVAEASQQLHSDDGGLLAGNGVVKTTPKADMLTAAWSNKKEIFCLYLVG